MSLLEDEIKPTPRNYLLGLLADAAQKANETVSRPAGYDNPPARMLMSLLGVPAIAQTLDRLSYGEPLTTGRGMTTKMRPEVTEALLSVAPGVGPAAKATGKAAKSVAPKAAQMAEQYMFEQGLAKPIIVWHGSPHKFDKFDASKIGTGEGAQAYGHGLYFAEAPDVATSYKNLVQRDPNRLMVDGKVVSPDTMYGRAAEDVARIGVKATLQKIDDNIRFNEKYAPDMAAMYKDLRTKIEALEPTRVSLKEGNLYKVDLPDEKIARMLDWDKPLSQQPELISELIDVFGLPKNFTGSDAYDALTQKFGIGMRETLDKIGQSNAASILQQRGIPGIRYLDQGSRSAGQGTSNFVIFPGEESILKILERNGIPIESLL